jgi:hypothetical protein
MLCKSVTLIYILLNQADFQIINFTRPEGGDNTGSISPTDNAVKLFMWKSISFIAGIVSDMGSSPVHLFYLSAVLSWKLMRDTS